MLVSIHHRERDNIDLVVCQGGEDLGEPTWFVFEKNRHLFADLHGESSFMGCKTEGEIEFIVCMVM